MRVEGRECKVSETERLDATMSFFCSRICSLFYHQPLSHLQAGLLCSCVAFHGANAAPPGRGHLVSLVPERKKKEQSEFNSLSAATTVTCSFALSKLLLGPQEVPFLPVDCEIPREREQFKSSVSFVWRSSRCSVRRGGRQLSSNCGRQACRRTRLARLDATVSRLLSRFLAPLSSLHSAACAKNE